MLRRMYRRTPSVSSNGAGGARLSAGLMIAVALLALAAITTAARAATEVKIGYLPIADGAPLYAGIEQGYFNDVGLKLKLVPMAGGGMVVSALASGALQFGFGSTSSAVNAWASGFAIHILSDGSLTSPKTPYTGILVRKDSALRSAGDLEGKRVTVPLLRGIMEIGLHAWMRKHGADPTKVKLVEIPFPQMGGALFSRQVDAISEVEPFMTIFAKKSRVLAYHMQETAPWWHISSYYVREKFSKSDPRLVRGFVRAYNRGVDWVLAHPKETRAMLPRHTRLKPPLAARIVMPEFRKGVSRDLLQHLVDQMSSLGFLEKQVNIAKIISPLATSSSE